MRARGRVSVVIAAIAVLGAVAVPRINAHRVQDADGCPRCVGTPSEAASQRHSEDMARRHFFAHDTPDGMSPGERMGAAGYDYRTCECLVGQNLYLGAGIWVGKRRAALYRTDFGGA